MVVDDSAQAVDGDGDVFVFVGVDTDDDVGAFERDAGHWIVDPFTDGRWSNSLVGREGQDCDGTW